MSKMAGTCRECGVGGRLQRVEQDDLDSMVVRGFWVWFGLMALVVVLVGLSERDVPFTVVPGIVMLLAFRASTRVRKRQAIYCGNCRRTY